MGLEAGVNFYQFAPNTLGWIDPLGLAKDKTYIVTRNMSEKEANSSLNVGGLVAGLTNGKEDRRAKWVNINGANWNATTKKPPPTHTLTLEITQEGYDMLTKGTVEAGQESQQTKCVLKKENEKNARGIGVYMLGSFNKTIKKISVSPLNRKRER